MAASTNQKWNTERERLREKNRRRSIKRKNKEAK